MRTHTRKMGGIAPGVPPQGAKTCFVFLLSRQRGLSVTYLHRFGPFLKQQTWIAFHMRTPVKNFPISAQGFLHVPKTPDFGTVESWVLVIELQVKRHNSRRSESFSELDDIPSMCLSWKTFARGCTVLAHLSPQLSPREPSTTDLKISATNYCICIRQAAQLS